MADSRINNRGYDSSSVANHVDDLKELSIPAPQGFRPQQPVEFRSSRASSYASVSSSSSNLTSVASSASPAAGVVAGSITRAGAGIFGGDVIMTENSGRTHFVEMIQTLNTLPTKSKKQPPKKNRIACANCQSRKQRCDEKRPCSRCVRNGRECVDRSGSSITAKPPILKASSIESFSNKPPVVKANSVESVSSVEELYIPGNSGGAPAHPFTETAGNTTPTLDPIAVPNTSQVSWPTPNSNAGVVSTPMFRRNSSDSVSSVKMPVDDLSYYREITRRETPQWLKMLLMQVSLDSSPLFVEEFIRSNPVLDRFILGYCRNLLGDDMTREARMHSLDIAISVTRPEFRDFFESLKSRMFPPRIQYNFSGLDYNTLDSEDVESICNVFNIRDIRESDLAIVRHCAVMHYVGLDSYELIPQTVQTSMNGAMEKLMDCTVDEFGDLYVSSPAETNPDPIFYFFGEDCWQKIALFCMASTMSDIAVSTVALENFDFVDCCGIRIPVCVYCIAKFAYLNSSDQTTHAERTWTKTFVIRPFSHTFSPTLEDLNRIMLKFSNPKLVSFKI
eukprot:TRINITY_DN15720_c0_g1_i1.p1 TRINITY_DN15720_c0_g1~~TRINITY_DN15720_c0_g1_i1.p1  ORF type:complete len:562 (+),score=122.32 TRINITY_DN15720_c0_g1_i1:140-1825(+)